jgi:hypothetical protein
LRTASITWSREVVGKERVGVDLDLILLDETAHRGDLGHPGHAPEPVLDVPVVESAKAGEIVLSAPVDERVLEAPSDPGGVGAEHRLDSGREPSL